MPTNLTDASMTLLVLAMGALLGLWVGRRSPRGALGVLVLLGAWLVVTAMLAESGALSVWTARPPRLPMLPLAVLGTMLLARRTAPFQALVAATPPAWFVLAQAFRVPVELILFALHRAGRVPVQVTFEGRNLDILVGLSAPLVAWLIARGRASARWVVAWNVLGLVVLASTVFTVVTSAPGPLHLDWPGAPLTELAAWPMVWLPAFLAPLAVALHVTSLQQALHRLRSPAERQKT